MNDKKQRTPEWFAARCGNLNASKVGDIMPSAKTGKYLKSRETLMEQLLVERLTGECTHVPVTDAMQWGIDHEEEAIAYYEFESGLEVLEVGSVPHPTIKGLSASPDGLQGGNTVVEVKCPGIIQHFKNWRCDDLPYKYRWQIATQCACTCRPNCVFISYDPRFVAVGKELKVIENLVPQNWIDTVEREATKFLDELDEIEREIRK